MNDYKDWINNEAESIANWRYGKDCCNLPQILQTQIYNEATEAYKDYLAGQIDESRESLKYKGVIK